MVAGRPPQVLQGLRRVKYHALAQRDAFDPWIENLRVGTQPQALRSNTAKRPDHHATTTLRVIRRQGCSRHAPIPAAQPDAGHSSRRVAENVATRRLSPRTCESAPMRSSD